MLKKRSKTVSSKQSVVSHNISLTPPTGNLTQRPISFLFPLKNPFSSFFCKVFSDPEASVISPNFTLKPFLSIRNHLFSSRKLKPCCLNEASRIKRCPWSLKDSKPVGLAIVDAISNEKADEKSSLIENRIVLLGSQLKIQIPSINQNSSFRTQLVGSSHRPVKSDVKNQNSKPAMNLLPPDRRSPQASTITTMENSLRALRLYASEIALSEDYTCVISHGPQQKKIHIFDNFIIESCNDGFNNLRELKLSDDRFGGYTSDYFLAFCHTCRNKIAEGNDIFISRGDKAFCSQECRNREIVCHEGRDNSGSCAFITS